MTERRNDPLVYALLTGHVRNVGDSLLRRAYACALRDGAPISVWTGAPGSGYEAGLGLSPGESAPSFRSWYWSFVRSVVRSRPVFAFNAGAFGVTKAYLAGVVALLPWLLLLKLKGGRIIWVGAAVSERRGVFSWPFDVLARLAHLLVWRDTESAGRMGRGSTAPDWAFGLYPGGGWEPGDVHPAPLEAREFLAVALRGDRPDPGAAWLAAVADLGRRLGLTLAFVAQVEDDDALAGRLAAELGGEHVRWASADHSRQERLVREWYGRSALLISDRLHGLIVAATEGAVPLGWTDRPTRKIAVHMDLVGAPWASVAPSQDAVDLLGGLDAAALAARRDQTDTLVVAARAEVHAVGRRLVTGASPSRRPTE